MSISFSGLASGLDTSSWVTSLVALKQAKVNTLEAEKEELQISRETLNNIKTFFSSFRTCIEKITDTKFNIPSMDLFAQNLAVSANLDVLTATATTEAEEASYNIKVNNLATNTQAASAYNFFTTIIQTTTASFDSKLINLGVQAGNILVKTADGVEHGIEITDSDTITSFTEKLKGVGVNASFNDKTGIFMIDVGASDIIDKDNTGIVSALHLTGVNEGYTSSNLEVKSVDTVWTPALESTKLSELGVKNGSITVSANESNYGFTINDNTTLKDLLDFFQSKNIDASLDKEGVFTLKDAVITNDGTTGLKDAFGLNEEVSSNFQSSGALSYQTIVTDVTAVDLNTKLSDIGEGTVITGNQTVIVKNSNNENCTITVTSSSTLGDLLTGLANAGLNAELKADGRVEITGGTITGGSFDAIGVLGLNSDPYTSYVTGKELTETIEVYELVTLDTKLVDDLGVSEGYLKVTDSEGRDQFLKIYSGQTIQNLMADLANFGIYSELNEETGVLTITGGAFETLSDTDVNALIADGTIRETEDRYQHGSNLLTLLYGSASISVSQTGVAQTHAMSNALRYTVTNTIQATSTTTLGALGLSGTQNAVFDVRGESRTINVTTTTTIDDLITKLAAVGISAEFDAEHSKIEIQNAYITSSSSAGTLGGVLALETSIAGKYITSNALYQNVEEVAGLDSVISNFITLPTDKTLVVHDDIGGAIGTVTVTSTMTFGEMFNALDNLGIQSSMDDGVISFTSNNGAYVSGAILGEYGMDTVTTTLTVTTTTGTTTTGASYKYTLTQSATGDNTFAQIGSTGNKTWLIRNGQTGDTVASGTFADSTTIGEFLDILGQYGFSGSIDGGFVTVSSPQGYYVTGTAADALGLGTYNYTMTVHGTGTNTIAATDTFTIDQTRTITSSGFVTVSSSDTVVVDITTVSSVNTSGYVTVKASDTITVDVTRTIKTDSSGTITIHATDTITVDVTRTQTVTSTGTTTVTVTDTITVSISQTIDTGGTGSTVISNTTVITMTIAQTLTTTITTTAATTQTQTINTFATKATSVSRFSGGSSLTGNYIIWRGEGTEYTVSISSTDSIGSMLAKLNNNPNGVYFDYDETTGKFFVGCSYENNYRWGVNSSTASKLHITTKDPMNSKAYHGYSSGSYWYDNITVTTVVDTTSTIKTTSTVSVEVTKTITDTFTVALDTTGETTVDVTRTYTISDTQTVGITTTGLTTVIIQQTLAIDATQTITVSTSGTYTVNMQQTLTVSATSTEKVDTTGYVTVNVKQTLTINTTSTEQVETTGTVNISQTVTVTAHQTITVDVTSTRTVTANKSTAHHNEFSTVHDMDGNTKIYQAGLWTSGTISGVSNGKEFSITVNVGETIDGLAARLAAYGIEVSINNGAVTFNGTNNGYITDATAAAASLGAASAYTTSTETTISGFNTNSDTQNRTITVKMTDDTKLKDLTDASGANLGITSGQVYVYQNGTRYSVNINNNDTISELKAKLSQYGITVTSAIDGKLYFDGDDNSYITTTGLASSAASNILAQIGINSDWSTRYNSTSQKLQYTQTAQNVITEDTKVTALNSSTGASLGITTGEYTVYQNGVRTTETITDDTTVGDLIATLGGYGMNANIHADGSIEIGAFHNTYLATSATTGDNTNLISTLFAEWDFTNIYTSNNLSIPEDKTIAISKTTKLADINEGTYSDGYITVVKDGVQTNISLTSDDTVGTLMDELALYGFDSVINDKGQLIIKNSGNSLLQAYAGTDKSSNALNLLGIELPNWIQTSMYDSSSLDVVKTSVITTAVTRDTALSELGITTGEYNIINNGVKYTALISSDETIGSFIDTLAKFGIEASIVTNGNSSILSITGKGDISVQTSSSTTNASNVVNVLFPNANNDTKYTYTGELATSTLATTYTEATVETLLSDLDIVWGDETLKAQGALSVTVDGITSVINIEADDTIGLLLEKFRTLELEADISNGKLLIQSGYRDFTINQSGTTSNIVANFGLTYHDDLGGYSASEDVCEATTTAIEERTLSVSNYADLSTKLSQLNISSGTLTVYKNGQKASIQVNSDETFADLRSRISAVFNDVDLAFENGYLKIFSKNGDSIEAGSTTDTSNISAICGLTSDGSGVVTSARSLYRVNEASKITTSGLFRKGDVKEGSFTIGNALFNITNDTSVKDIITQINSSEEANATAYWDSISGQLIIKSRTTGAALINIEAGSSNFTDIMGYTTTENSINRMDVKLQEVGKNASFSINGTTYTSASNTVGSDITRIKGVTINLKGVSPEGEEVKLTIEKDKETLANAMSDIVDAYNELIENVDKEVARGAQLSGESALKLLRNRIRSLMTSSSAAGTVFRNLDAIGITADAAKANSIQTDSINVLYFDKDKFIKAFDADQDAVKSLLIGTSNNGIFTQIEDVVESALSSVYGYFDSADKSYQTKINKLDTKITKANKDVEKYRARLEAKFASMDLLIANMQQQYSSFLTT